MRYLPQLGSGEGASTNVVRNSRDRGSSDERDLVAFIEGSVVGFDHDAAASLAASMWTVELDPGEFLFHQGQPSDRFSILLSGEMDVQRSSADGRDLVFVTLGPGAPIGEVSIFDGSPRTASLRARTPATVLTIGRARFLELLGEHPSMARSLAIYLASVVQRLTGNVEGRAFQRLDVRLLDQLADLAVVDGRGVALVTATQQALADRLGVSRESVNKQLRSWASEDLVELRRGRIRIADLDRLRDQLG